MGLQRLCVRRKAELGVNEIAAESLLYGVDEIEGLLKSSDVRYGGEFRLSAIFLPVGYDYVLGVDDEDVTILVPVKRGVE